MDDNIYLGHSNINEVASIVAEAVVEGFEGYEYFVLGEFLAAICVMPLTGTYNGYLGLPAMHPWTGVDFEELPGTPDRELSYSAPMLGMVDEPHPLIAWWIGFDTNHPQDFAPEPYKRKVARGISHRTLEEEAAFFGQTFKTREYAVKQLEFIAQQAGAVWQQYGPVDPEDTARRAEITQAQRQQRVKQVSDMIEEWAHTANKTKSAFHRLAQQWLDNNCHPGFPNSED